MSEEIAKRDLVTIRPAAQTDYSFILQSFLKALYFGNQTQKKVQGQPWTPTPEERKILKRAPIDLFSQMRQETFYRNYEHVIQRLLSKEGTHAFVASLNEDPDVILGWSIFEPQILHFVFIKEVWRRIGLAKDLIPNDVKYMTHLTKVGLSVAPKHWEYNPFLI